MILKSSGGKLHPINSLESQPRTQGSILQGSYKRYTQLSRHKKTLAVKPFHQLLTVLGI